MKIAYFDCLSGISGDMTVSALLDAGARIESIQNAVASMGLSDVTIRSSQTTRKGFRGTLFQVEHSPQSTHRNLYTILTLIRRSAMTIQAKDLAMRIFERLGRVEARVHGTTLDRVHFHEIGAIDSIVDIVGAAVAWDELGIERAYASPIPTGTGTVKIAHGIVGIPAPATAELLADVPIEPCGLPFEMTTPTGAAIVAEIIHEFGPMPSMQVSRIGYGSGQREMPDRPNLLRVLLGHAVARKTRYRDATENSMESDKVSVLETNLDDVTGEQIGFAIELAWKAGALDVFTTPIQMKKNRPGVMLTILCRCVDRKIMESVLFEHTGTLGIRHQVQTRTTLPRSNIDIETPWGIVSGKIATFPSGKVAFSAEYDDCREIALENNLRLSEVMEEMQQIYSHGIGIDSELESVSETENSDLRINQALQQAAVEDQLIEFSETQKIDTYFEGLLNTKNPDLESGNYEEVHKDAPDLVDRWDSSTWS